MLWKYAGKLHWLNSAFEHNETITAFKPGKVFFVFLIFCLQFNLNILVCLFVKMMLFWTEYGIWKCDIHSMSRAWIKWQYAEPNTIFGKFIQILPKDGKVFNFWKLPNACGEDPLFWCFFLFSNLLDFCFFVINGSWNVILPCHSTKLQEDRKLVIWWKYYLVIDTNTIL